MDPSERPTKRPRLSASAVFDNVQDIDKVRRQNDLRFQGRFQAIINKYDRDFTGLADVIDLQTMDVVVDNGHLAGLQHETDITRRSEGKRATARRHVPENYEHDELSSEAAQERTDSVAQPQLRDSRTILGSSLRELDENDRPVRNQTAFARRLASTLATQDIPFDPYDPVSVAELGKSIAVELAQLMRTARPPREKNLVTEVFDQPSSLTLTPPTSDPGVVSPYHHTKLVDASRHTSSVEMRSPRRRANEAGARQPGYSSIWASRFRSSTPETQLEDPNDEAQQQLPGAILQEAKIPRNGRGWSQKEDDLLLQLAIDNTLSWARRASHFPERSVAAIQVHYGILQSKIPGLRQPGYANPAHNAPSQGNLQTSTHDKSVLRVDELVAESKRTRTTSRVDLTSSRSLRSHAKASSASGEVNDTSHVLTPRHGLDTETVQEPPHETARSRIPLPTSRRKPQHKVPNDVQPLVSQPASTIRRPRGRPPFLRPQIASQVPQSAALTAGASKTTEQSAVVASSESSQPADAAVHVRQRRGPRTLSLLHVLVPSSTTTARGHETGTGEVRPADDRAKRGRAKATQEKAPQSELSQAKASKAKAPHKTTLQAAAAPTKGAPAKASPAKASPAKATQPKDVQAKALQTPVRIEEFGSDDELG